MGQRGMLLLEQVTHGTEAYNVGQAMRARGPLDLGALHAAADELVRRHEVLRTRFLTEGPDGARIEILPEGRAEFSVVDLASGPEEVDDAIGEFVLREVSGHFDLASGSLYRCRVATVGPDDHIIVLVSHHIASDLRSKQVLNAELETLYTAFKEHRPSPLPEPALQYADYAAWLVENDVTTEDLDWWRKELAAAPDQTDLPHDRPRPTGGSFRGARFVERLPAELVARMKVLAGAHRATTYNLLLAAYAALVERHAGQGEVLVGSNVSGRHDPGLDDVVGLFLNTLPVRVDTSGQPGLGTLLDRSRDAAVGTMRHQSVPMEVLVDQLRPQRVAGRSPFFQTTLTWKSANSKVPSFADLDVTPIPFDSGRVKFDLSLIAFPVGDELGVLWEYNTALFDEATVRRMARQFELLLDAGTRAPELPVTAVRLTTADDEQALARWTSDVMPEPSVLVPEMMAAQARLTPHAIAVADQRESVTYRELDRRVNQLAHHLLDLGVGPDDRVAVMMERSVGLEVALLSVLRAGGAYVPLDPGYPADRLAFMLEDSQAKVLLTQSWLAGIAPTHDRTVHVDAFDGRGLPTTAPDVEITGSNLAYVIYTSGTTGRPKGVMVEHRGLASHLAWARDHFGLGTADTILQKTPYSFDVSVWELLLAPVTGARLFMAEPERHGDPWYLAEVIEAEAVTVLNFVPSMLRAFLAADVAASCESVTLVITCGEALPDEVKDDALKVWPELRLENLYGPTEATVAVAWERCEADQPVTIGHPIGNCTLVVLDEHGQQVPVGMPGEICLGGVQLARGYANRPDLTAEKFVDNPLGRLYRTGDRGVWRSDGRLQYLGRLDDQVKLRGFRIELGEVESVLASHPGVEAAPVVVRSAPSGDQFLAAYVLRQAGPAGAEVTEAELTALARVRLPEYMVPQVVEFLAELPLTPAGKLDRRALQQRPLPSLLHPVVAPANESEAILARLWAEELGVETPISTDVSFFDLGGNSLVALRLFPKIERQFKVRLDLSILFENVTISSLARAIEVERYNETPWDLLATIQPQGSRTPVFAFPGWRGDALTYVQIAPWLDTDRPVHVAQVRGLDGRQPPRTRLADVATDAYEAIRRVQPRGPYQFLGFCYGGVVAYEVASRLEAQGEAVTFLCLVESTPFGRGSLSAPRRAMVWRKRSLKDWRGRLRVRARNSRNYWVTRAYGWTRRPVPMRFVDLTAINRVASRGYVAPDTALDLTLLRASTGQPEFDEARRRRWANITTGSCELRLLDGGPVDHLEVVKGDFARQIAEFVNGELAQRP